jgi:serine/threonine protein kinase
VYKTKEQRLVIVMEYAEQGELNFQVEKRNERLSEGDKEAYFKEEEILDLLAQVLMALDYMHSKNIIHRDIKSHNMLVMENGQVKMADFGIAEVLDSTNSLV